VALSNKYIYFFAQVDDISPQQKLFIKDLVIEDLSTQTEQIVFLSNKFGKVYLKLSDSYLMNTWKSLLENEVHQLNLENYVDDYVVKWEKQ